MDERRYAIMRHCKWAKLLKTYLHRWHKAPKFRCKIVGTEKNQQHKTHLWVAIEGIKNSLPVSFSPEELVLNNFMLREFSQEDVRTITYYAIKNIERSAKIKSEKLILKKQEFIKNHTVYVIHDEDKNSEIRKTARELYADSALLAQFKLNEIINIVSTAVQEQLIEDLEE